MQRFISAIRTCVQSENWYAALFLAIAMPDICSKLQEPTPGSSGPRYRAWFDKYLTPTNTINIAGREAVFITSADCWALRCSLLHEGTDDISEQHARQTLSRFRFTTLGSHRIRINDVLVLNTARFCEEVCQAVEAWGRDVEAVTEIQERIKLLVSIEHGEFSPRPGVHIG